MKLGQASVRIYKGSYDPEERFEGSSKDKTILFHIQVILDTM